MVRAAYNGDKMMILQGDVLQMPRTLADESVNCIITSPPYFGLRDYNLPATDWPEVTYAPMAGLPELTIQPMTCCLGLEDSIEAYVGHMVLVWRELWRVLRGDGVGWLNLGDSYAGSNMTGGLNSKESSDKRKKRMFNRHPDTMSNLKPKNLCGIPWRVAFALQADGWYLRSDIIWHKKSPMPESVRDRPTKAHEYLFLLAKSDRYWYDQDAIRENFADERMGNPGKYVPHHNIGRQRNDGNQIGANGEWNGSKLGGRNRRTVWSISSTPFPGAHFAVMPEALVEPCLLAGCPAQVCAKCGEPWVRVVERKSSFPTKVRKDHPTRYGDTENKSAKGFGMPSINTKTKTIGLAPTCQCSAPTRPGVALDPFFGSGTVGVVTKKNKRDYIGIELNAAYIKLAQERLNQTPSPLFAPDTIAAYTGEEKAQPTECQMSLLD